jgi:hypothetical protein
MLLLCLFDLYIIHFHGLKNVLCVQTLYNALPYPFLRYVDFTLKDHCVIFQVLFYYLDTVFHILKCLPCFQESFT